MVTAEKVKPEDIPNSMKSDPLNELIDGAPDAADVEGLDPLKAEFERHDRIIRDGLKQFIAVGRSLLAFRDQELYVLAGHKSFKQCIRDRYGLSKSRAYQLITAVEIENDLRSSTIVEDGQLPENEAQYRELARIADDEVAEVWQGVVQHAELQGLPITAQLIRERVSRYRAGADQRATEAIENVEADDDDEQPDDESDIKQDGDSYADEPFDETAATDRLSSWLRTELGRWPEDRRGVAADHVIGVLDEYTEAEDTSAQ